MLDKDTSPSVQSYDPSSILKQQKQIIIDKVTSSDLFSDAGQSQKISVIELDSHMIIMNNNQQISEDDSAEIIVTADMTDSDFAKTPNVPITASTPDFTCNNRYPMDQSRTGKNSEIEPKDVSLAPIIEIINTSMDLTSPEKSQIQEAGCKTTRGKPNTEIGGSAIIFSPSNYSIDSSERNRQEFLDSQFLAVGDNAKVGSLTTRNVFKQDSGAASSSNSGSLRQGTKVNLAPPMQVMGGDDVVEEEAYI